MSTKPSRASPSPSSPTGSNHGPKLPKFLKTNRDRSKSMVDPAGSPTPSSSSSSPALPETPKHKKPSRRGSIFKDAGSRRQSQDVDAGDVSISRDGEDTPDEPPVIVEPSGAPRPRTRSERPLSDNYPSVQYYSPGSNPRLSDLPTRLSGWFAHTFSTSSTDLSLPSLLSQQHLSASVSPKGKGSALLTAARHGKGHLDKAMRYLLDSDATPDKCPEPIWLLGVQHPGYEPSPPPAPDPNASPARRSSADSRRGSAFRSSNSSPGSPSSAPPDPSLSQSQPPSSYPANSKDRDKDPSKNWPPVFYADFTSRIWLTYRSQFFPIRDTTLAALEQEVHDSPTGLPSSPPSKRWNWPIGGEKGWTSDAGWGCMLRTGQSLLANALLHLHLGRDWRRPPHPVYTADYAMYVQIVTWFLDTPSPLCPFSVHRMALVGKDLGKEVGQWFGPSTAAGAIKTLVHSFPDAGLAVAVASDSTLYESDVYAASRSSVYSTRRHGHPRMEWGDRAVLILIGIRLGIEGVNPLYYNTIKTLYTFPQSVGIAGGRPSSSYYFVGSQADNLFYLDPHHARPAIPLRPPPRDPSEVYERQSSPEAYASDRERQYRTLHHVRSPTSPMSIRSTSSTGSASSFSYRSPTLAPSPLQQQVSTSSASTSDSSQYNNNIHTRWQSASVLPDDSAEMDSRELGLGADLDPLQRHYVTAYSQTELKTFHCDRVRKMPLSGLDPSMLLGFLCKDEAEWLDLKERITELFRTNKSIFSLANEPPHYPSDSDDMGLESISEPDIDMPDDDEFSLGNSPRDSPAGSIRGSAVGGSVGSEVGTEEDPIAPLTPSAGKASFDIDAPERMKRAASNQSTQDSLSFDDEDDEEWADPPEFSDPHLPLSETAPVARGSSSPESPPVIAAARSTSSTASKDTTGTGKTTRRKTKKGSSGGGSTKAPRTSQQAESQVQYPFPAGDPEDEEPERAPAQMQGKRVPQMRTAKARDGGRTQSGGIKGVLMDDADDF
ncbi:peptidase family C54-domain-containing protein [Dichomitus squalens]|uniref:Cysteine protease n=1 Tax=Dichomitus squalens TaxID=114155 RepID=A0A4Q9NG79_9APHY|nr:peptidase family C54-domain-containing protein [Dichomitus squalens]TBU55019.1 peptidase family C54-domain-containing protein [Dichomitus squalens]